MTRRQMLTALFGAAVLALPVAGCGHQPGQEQQGAARRSLLLHSRRSRSSCAMRRTSRRIILLRRRRWPLRILWPSAPMAA